MNRRYSISYFVLLVAVALAFMYAYAITEPKLMDEAYIEDELKDGENFMIQNEQNEYVDGNVSSQVLPNELELLERENKKESGYYIKCEDGLLVVYLHDNSTVFERTGIYLEELPQALQEEIKDGKYIATKEGLYGLLENYSS